jgi:hypothetical protein
MATRSLQPIEPSSPSPSSSPPLRPSKHSHYQLTTHTIKQKNSASQIGATLLFDTNPKSKAKDEKESRRKNKKPPILIFRTRVAKHTLQKRGYPGNHPRMHYTDTTFQVFRRKKSLKVAKRKADRAER